MKYIPAKVRDDSMGDWLHSKGHIEDLKEWKIKYGDSFFSPIEVPCGKCIGCRLDKSREWALRCMMELKYHEQASFITLTYNERSAPISYFPDPDTGVAIPVYSLRKKHLQDFWKRLRIDLVRKVGEDVRIRYFSCGEYGSETWRPHYHAIVFGYRPSDLCVTQRNQNGCYFQSEELDKIWSFGNCIVANVDFNSCAYVARYTAKKTVGTLGKDFFSSHNIEEPFLCMSRRPGIGWQYMVDHKDMFENDHIYVSGSDPVDGKLPRSFILKIEESEPELYAQIKERRKLAGDTYSRSIMMAHKVPYSKILADAEANLLARSRGISRNKA